MGKSVTQCMMFPVVLAICSAVAATTSDEMVNIDGGEFMMGTNDIAYNQNQDGEGPARRVSVKAFQIDVTPVTNADFRRFVRKTKYKTEAEEYGWSFVMSYLASAKTKADKTTQSLPDAKQWLAVGGAWWRQPEGPDSSIKGKEDYPVTHISLRDAQAYCKWAGKRLPQEMEWERAARGGVEGDYPWDENSAKKDGKHMMNVWQGKFPDENTQADGYAGTAPVKAFPANNYGVYATIGDTWEWTTTLYAPPPPKAKGKEQQEQPQFVLRGGSFVDSADGSFNHKARVTTRMGNNV